MKVYPQLDVLD